MVDAMMDDDRDEIKKGILNLFYLLSTIISNSSLSSNL